VAAASRAEQQHEIDPDACDIVMRGWAWWYRPSTISTRQGARRAFELALTKDLRSIAVKIGLAATITQILVEGWSSYFDQDQAVAERLLREIADHDIEAGSDQQAKRTGALRGWLTKGNVLVLLRQ